MAKSSTNMRLGTRPARTPREGSGARLVGTGRRRRGPALPPDILATKLYVPRPRSRLVGRPRLLARLDAGTTRPLTLLCAPAGFGKTTLVADWSEHLRAAGSAARLSWLSLDDADNDPIRFAQYLAAAFQRIAPRAAAALLNALRAAPAPSVPALLGVLINDLAGASRDCVLVLDDYHVIKEPAVHAAVAFLLDHAPPRFHLLIATREDPPLPLARLRGRDALVELRQADLRFTAGEAASFLRDVMGLTISPADVDALEERTEGWIAGLQMAGLSMQEHADVSSFVAAFSGSNRYILDYLAEEVFNRQPTPVQDFLLRTSILDQLNAPLCEALVDGVCGRRADADCRGQDILDYLERGNLFVVPLDAERRSYRYHQLFADLLRARLRQTRPELLADLHAKASTWYERAGMPADAIGHALAGGDAARAARLITVHGFWLIGSGLARTVLGWMDSLPAELAPASPPLALIHAAALAATGEPEGVEEHLRDAERALLQDLPSVDARTARGQIATIRGRAALYLHGDVERAVALSQEALDVLPTAKRGTRAAALSTASTAYLVSGDVRPASERAIAAMVETAARSPNPGLAPRSIAILGRLQVMQGRLRRAAATYARAARLARGRPELAGVLSGLAYDFGMGDLLREWNDLDGAHRLLRQGLDAIPDTVFVLPHDALLGYTAMAGVLEARGEVAGAVETIDEFVDFAHRREFVPRLAARAGAVRARILLRHGGLSDAVRWVEGARLRVDGDVPYPREAEYLTLARVLLAEGRLADAAGLLTRLLDAAEAGGRGGSVIEILMLRALARRAQRLSAPAQADFTASLRLAEPSGYVRLYVDEGPPLEALLRDAAARGIVPSYTRKLLAAMHRTTRATHEPEAGQGAAEIAPLAEPLTPREREVLYLLAAGASNADMARRLGVAITTIQTHVHHIFGKFGVRSRTQALARAGALKLL